VSEVGTGQRIDKWLWFARFFKSRSLAAKAVTGRTIRVNGRPVLKASTEIREGDVLTFSKARRIRVVRVAALGTRRGPAPEARALYEDLTKPEDLERPPGPYRPKGQGRPTKAERRALTRLRGK